MVDIPVMVSDDEGDNDDDGHQENDGDIKMKKEVGTGRMGTRSSTIENA